MTRQWPRTLLAVGLFVAAPPVVAHHSVPAVFDESRHITLTGTITKIQWINPHIHMYLTSREPDGKSTMWEIETLPTNWMRNAGITREAFLNKAADGEVVTVHANPARDTSLRLGYLMRITYPDGHFFHVTGDPEAIASAK